MKSVRRDADATVPNVGEVSDRFSRIVNDLNGAMVIVTTSALGERAGCLVGFHCQCSIDPPRYAVWLSKANYTYRTALHASHLAVHFIGSEHRALAELFGANTGDDVDKFGLCSTELGPADVPLLADCRNRLVGRRRTVLDDDGDHVCFGLEPIHVDVAGLAPMRLQDVVDLSPGHEADEPPR